VRKLYVKKINKGTTPGLARVGLGEGGDFRTHKQLGLGGGG